MATSNKIISTQDFFLHLPFAELKIQHGPGEKNFRPFFLKEAVDLHGEEDLFVEELGKQQIKVVKIEAPLHEERFFPAVFLN